MKILLVGNGARAHIIADTLLRNRDDVEIFTVGKTLNPGLSELSSEYLLSDVMDFEGIENFAVEHGVDFAFIGPENPLAGGIVDRLLAVNIPSVGPMKELATLESSKSFSRDLLSKYNIEGNPEYRAFDDKAGLLDYIMSFGGDFVVKSDGLHGGKGVKVSGDHFQTSEEGFEYAKQCIADDGRVVIEEKFVGQEFSLMSFSDGNAVVSMPAVQDHKRAFDGDTGPNTGGMGAYSDSNNSLPFLTDEHIAQAEAINKKVVDALYKETGLKYKGVLYGGFILTPRGVRLIEYNVRFGDPEVMNVLSVLKTDLVEICQAIIDEKLETIEVEFEKKATVCKYVVPEGYPESPVKNVKIELASEVAGVKTYFGSVDKRKDGLYLAGSRALAFVGVGDTIAEAERLAEEAVATVKGPVFHRSDIGTQELIDKRIEMVNGF